MLDLLQISNRIWDKKITKCFSIYRTVLKIIVLQRCSRLALVAESSEDVRERREKSDVKEGKGEVVPIVISNSRRLRYKTISQ